MKKRRLLPLLAALLLLLTACGKADTPARTDLPDDTAQTGTDQLGQDDEGRAPTAAEQPDAVVCTVLQEREQLQCLEIQVGTGFPFTITDQTAIREVSALFQSAVKRSDAPDTFETVRFCFVYAGGLVTPMEVDLSANIYRLNNVYYDFTLRADGQDRTADTQDLMQWLLDADNWPSYYRENFPDLFGGWDRPAAPPSPEDTETITAEQLTISPDDVVSAVVWLGDAPSYQRYHVAITDQDSVRELARRFRHPKLLAGEPEGFDPHAQFILFCADGTTVTLAADLRTNLCRYGETYYSFSFRSDGEELDTLTQGVMYKLLQPLSWPEEVRNDYAQPYYMYLRGTPGW